MKEIGHEYSLLPYLEASGKNIFLKLSLISEDNKALEKTPYPFLSITESDPLTRIIEAQFVTDSNSELRKVFIMIQRDKYILKRDDLWPINNQDIADSWQNAFNFYTKEKQDHSLIILSNQINEKGMLMPLSSLFFCKQKELFFHPPCPRCGLPLKQCEDDELLTSSGLQSFSQSLKRYLFCASCVSSKDYDFYVNELEQSDPLMLKDRWTLIKEFGLFCENKKISGEFICCDCPDYQVCYGSSLLALSRIVPLSFYPFYMFIFNSMSLNSLDFLSLLSGATFNELEAQLEMRQEIGRKKYLKAIKINGGSKNTLFHTHDERYFLEVLFLKLTFVGDLIQSLSLEDNLIRHPDLTLSIDRLWVKLEDHSSLLPSFWNFKVHFMDIGRHMNKLQPSKKLPSSDELYFLGLLWFYALLANKKQGAPEINRSVNEIMDQFIYMDDESFEKFIKENTNSTFLPLNIFWDSEGKIVKQDWKPLWERSLYLGWSLFRTAFRFDPGWFEVFWQQLESLRKKVKDNIFKEESLAFHCNIEEENVAIHRILMNILKKWQAELEPEKESLKETVILSPSGLKKAPPPTKIKEDHEILPETVIITPKETDRGTSIYPQQQQSESVEPLEETVSLEELKKMEPLKKISKKTNDQDFLTETVILKPGKLKENSKDGTKE